MRKTIKTLLLMLAMTLCMAATAQDPCPKGWDAGLTVNYTCQDGNPNIGLQAVATTAITPLWGWRATAGVNGLVRYYQLENDSPLPPSQRGKFDRYAAVTTGPVVNLDPLYAFVQAGAALNPSTHGKLGLAANAGAGLQFDVGCRSRLFIEASVEFAQADSHWLKTFGAGIGYAYRL